ncbi:MAG: hypothetical protein ACSW8I_04580 [bacterium]
MPMFYIPKPRQFRYQPRFYDPEKERWEALKMKYALEHGSLDENLADSDIPEPGESTQLTDDDNLAYFQRRVREIEREKRHSKGGLTWKDMFRKREMPTFNYQPRFIDGGQPSAVSSEQSTGEHLAAFKKRSIKIKRRFDISDKDYMKPVPATRILLYTMLVCLLLYWILF